MLAVFFFFKKTKFLSRVGKIATKIAAFFSARSISFPRIRVPFQPIPIKPDQAHKVGATPIQPVCQRP